MKHCQHEAMPDRKRRGRPKIVVGLREQELNPGKPAQPARGHGPATPVGAGEKPLTQRQRMILAFIKEFTAQHLHPPTVREITMACRFSSTSVTDYNLRLLERKEYLIRKPRIARSIVLTGRGPLPFPVEAPPSGQAK